MGIYLGTRRIRSAGRTSGSIEVTLPPQLQGLEGTICQLTVRDGPRPEIVLQPDLSAAQTLFRKLWQKLRLALSEIDDIGDFTPTDFSITLFPPSHWQERPPLAYTDALAILQHQADGNGHNQALESLTRLSTFMAVAAGYRLGLTGTFALAFGDAVAYLITGHIVGLGTDFERGMAHRIFWEEDPTQAYFVPLTPKQLDSPLEDQRWCQVRAGLQRIYDQFRIWQAQPKVYTTTREKWYRALRIETSTEVAEESVYRYPR